MIKKRYASLRFDATSGSFEIDVIARALSSDDVVVASLSEAAGRGYAALDLAASADLDAIARVASSIARDVRLDEPALVVLDVRTESAADARRVREALAGPGGMAGAVTLAAGERSTIVELEETQTPLSLVVETIDIETRGRARRIVPLLPLDDAVLARFASARLREPDLDASRVIEFHLADLDSSIR